MLSIQEIRTSRRYNGTCSAPSEVKKIEHALVIPHQYTRSRLEMLLAFHYDS
jgi:hypothetical protein